MWGELAGHETLGCVSWAFVRALTMTGGFPAAALVSAARYTLRLPAGMLGQRLLAAPPNILGWHAMSIFGVRALASGRAAIIRFLIPIWTVLIGVFFFRER